MASARRVDDDEAWAAGLLLNSPFDPWLAVCLHAKICARECAQSDPRWPFERWSVAIASAGDEVRLRSVVLHVYYGAFKSQRVEQNVARVDALQFPVLEIDHDDARHAAEVRAHLASTRTPLGPYDLLIAGQARARKLTLVSHNTMEFRRVPGLKVEDWKGAPVSPPTPRGRKSVAKPRTE